MTNESTRKYAGDMVATLATAVFHGSHTLVNVPRLINRIIGEELWREYVRGGEVAVFDSFAELDTGLGTNVRTLQHLCRDDPGALDALDQAVVRTPGRPPLNVDNMNVIPRPTGASTSNAIRRLRRSRPDLHGRVLSGELSTHRAMVEAGFRKRQFSVFADPQRAASALRRHLKAEDLERLVELLKYLP